jgi:hypothetical protein
MVGPIGLLIFCMIILLCIGLGVWAASKLEGVGLPNPIVIAVQIIIILIGILVILQRAGLI